LDCLLQEELWLHPLTIYHKNPKSSDCFTSEINNVKIMHQQIIIPKKLYMKKIASFTFFLSCGEICFARVSCWRKQLYYIVGRNYKNVFFTKIDRLAEQLFYYMYNERPKKKLQSYIAGGVVVWQLLATLSAEKKFKWCSKKGPNKIFWVHCLGSSAFIFLYMEHNSENYYRIPQK
jgi:hypothetical protein